MGIVVGVVGENKNLGAFVLVLAAFGVAALVALLRLLLEPKLLL